jgi:dienelactone hydrolase
MCAALLLGIVGVGCSHAGKSTAVTTATGSPTTAPVGSVYAGGGNFTVGVATLFLPSGSAVEVWYPANGSVGVGSDTYDLRSFLPSSIARRLGPNVHAYVGTDANRNVLVGASGEQFPLVLFSHGYAGDRDQSTFLTTRLASWGMVVAAPEQPSRDLAHVLTPSATPVPSEVNDLLATIDLMRRENARIGGPFQARIDLSKIAVVGLDAGGRAAVLAATDPRVDAYVALATDNRGTPAAELPMPTPPKKPSLFVAGANDRVVAPAATAAAYRAASAPTYEWVIGAAGHNAFDDLCIVAPTQGGLPGLVNQSGMGSLMTASLRTVVTDGCTSPDLPVIKTWPIIDQVVTAFLRHAIGPDPVAVAVGPSGARTIDGVNVTISARLG